MTLNGYLEARVFRSPYLKRTESVSGAAVLWALLLGPIYYWRKQAPLEALIFVVLDAALALAPAPISGVDTGADLLGLLVWLAFGFGAPVLLPMCYRRKGWVEIGRSAEARWLSGEFAAGASEGRETFATGRRDRKLGEHGEMPSRSLLR